jgi:hypothetical protein
MVELGGTTVTTERSGAFKCCCCPSAISSKGFNRFTVRPLLLTATGTDVAMGTTILTVPAAVAFCDDGDDDDSFCTAETFPLEDEVADFASLPPPLLLEPPFDLFRASAFRAAFSTASCALRANVSALGGRPLFRGPWNIATDGTGAVFWVFLGILSAAFLF